METGTPRTGEAAGQVAAGLEISQWKYLPGEAGDPQMHAILSVRVDGTGGDGHPGGPVLAQVLVMDCSSSMTWPVEKLHAAQRAAVAAIRKLPDGTPFAVVRGNEQAAVVYPDTPRMARASARTRSRAERAVRETVAGGGTCIGAWLDLSRRLLTEQDAPIGHVLLLTDGKNQHDEQMPLARVLEECAGRFVCDAWGIGDGWDGRELLRITSRLHGSASSVREEEALPGEYEQLMNRLLTKTVPELVVSVTAMPGCTVRYLKQVFPTEAELTAEDGTGRFVTRAWGDETRRYQLCLAADPTGRPRGRTSSSPWSPSTYPAAARSGCRRRGPAWCTGPTTRPCPGTPTPRSSTSSSTSGSARPSPPPPTPTAEDSATWPNSSSAGPCGSPTPWAPTSS